MKVLESNLVTPQENEAVEEFVDLVNWAVKSLPAETICPIFEGYFPGIFNEL
jgi:hypothetical protein